MKNRRTRIIGFYGGPSIGKSAAAWTAAAWLKRNGASVELANEYVKKWAWLGREVKPLDELTILGQQIAEEADLLGKVDFIVTEKPVVLDLAYCRIYQPEAIIKAVEESVAAHYQHVASLGHQHINVIFRRVQGGYDTRGRYESRRQAELVDKVAEQVMGELACDGRFKAGFGKLSTAGMQVFSTFDRKAPTYPIYLSHRNRIVDLLHYFYDPKTRRPK